MDDGPDADGDIKDAGGVRRRAFLAVGAASAAVGAGLGVGGVALTKGAVGPDFWPRPEKWSRRGRRRAR